MLTVKAEYRLLAIFHYTQKEDFYRVYVEDEEYQRYDELKSNEKHFLCSFFVCFVFLAVDHNVEYGNKKQYFWNLVYSDTCYSYGGGIGSIITWVVAQCLNAPLSFW